MAGPLGSTPGIIVGVGVGTAVAAAIEPKVITAAQGEWNKNQFKVFPPGTLAELVAQGYIGTPQAEAEAGFSGWNPARQDALIQLAMRSPGIESAMAILRRTSGPDFSKQPGADALFTHALRKAAIEPQYDPGMAELRWHLLDLAQVANAIQQGHITDEKILPPIAGVAVPAGGVGNVTAPDGQAAETIDPTIVALSGIDEAAGMGWDVDRLTVAANLVGLPPAQHELLQMWNRGIIDEASVDIGIREGHQKTKWTTPFKRLRWSVLSELQYVEARVRGWITNQELYDGGALTGYTEAQLDLLHSTHGRPLSFRDVQRGLARGGVRLDPVADFTGANPIAADGSKVPPINDTLFKALQQSNIQQQWYDLARHMATNPPSLFMLNRLALADPTYIPRAILNLGYLGIDQPDIDAITKYWNDQTGTSTANPKADPYVTKANGQLWTALHSDYVKKGVDRATVESAMTVLVADAANREIIFERWDTEKTLGSPPAPPAA